MDKVIEVVIVVDGTDYLRITQPLNPNASILTGLNVTVKGTAVTAIGQDPAGTEFQWKAEIPIVIPQGRDDLH